MQKLLVKDSVFSKINIIEIINNIFDKKVYKFTYLGKCKLNKMPEYDFCLYEFNAMLNDFSNYTVYIKGFSRSMLEETLFCYWQFCEENYNVHGNFYLHKANLKIKSLKENKNNNQKYSLQLLSKNNKIWKASDINIVELKKIKELKNAKMYNRKDYKKNIESTYEFLFIGII